MTPIGLQMNAVLQLIRCQDSAERFRRVYYILIHSLLIIGAVLDISKLCIAASRELFLLIAGITFSSLLRCGIRTKTTWQLAYFCSASLLAGIF